jgi:hypothetical protein
MSEERRAVTPLAQISGQFILSVNDVPETREFFRRFAIETVATCPVENGPM